MSPEVQKILEDQQKKIDAIYVSVEKTRKYFFWTLIITVVLFVLPLIAMAFAIPSFINIYSQQVQELGL
ncbi:MAG: hypothetical protein V4519_00180 [Patescibacteria group bacterium]